MADLTFDVKTTVRIPFAGTLMVTAILGVAIAVAAAHFDIHFLAEASGHCGGG